MSDVLRLTGTLFPWLNSPLADFVIFSDAEPKRFFCALADFERSEEPRIGGEVSFIPRHRAGMARAWRCRMEWNAQTALGGAVPEQINTSMEVNSEQTSANISTYDAFERGGHGRPRESTNSNQ